MQNNSTIKAFLSGDYKSAILQLDERLYPLELAYAYFFEGNNSKALDLLSNLDSIRAKWLQELVNLMITNKMKSVTYFEIRNFLEIDIDLLIKAQKIDYLQRLLAYSPELAKINTETYKFIGRILLNSNLMSLAKYYLDKYKDMVYFDPELHFMYARYYIYCCLLKTIVKAIAKANAIIAVITNVIKSMYIIAV